MQQYVILHGNNSFSRFFSYLKNIVETFSVPHLKKKKKTKSPNICCCYLTLFLKLAPQSSPAKNTC